MKKFMFVADIFFIIFDFILLVLLFYYGIANTFTLTVIASIIAALFIVLSSVMDIIKNRR